MHRAAAADQMRTWGDRVGAETVRADREGRPGRDVGALAERLTALLSDPATVRAMGDKGRA